MHLVVKMMKSLVLLCLAFLGIIYIVNLPTRMPADYAMIHTLKGIFAWDIGITKYRASITDEAVMHFMRSIKVIIPAFLLSMVLGISKGLVMFMKRNSKIRGIWMVDRLLFGSLPDFFIYISIQYFLLLLFRMGVPKLDLFGFDRWYNLILPVTILCIYPIVYISNITMKSLSENITKDYIRTAYAKGTDEYYVTTRHLLWNAWPTILSHTQSIMLYIVTSLPVIELISYYKGAGYLTIYAIKKSETALIIPLSLFFLGIMLAAIWFSDIVKYFLVPSEVEQEVMETTISKRRRFVFIKRVFQFCKKYPFLAVGTFMIGILLFLSIFGSYLPFVDKNLAEFQFKILGKGNILVPPLPPSEQYPIGTDRTGRDLLSLLVMGTKETLLQIFFISVIRYIVAIPMGYFASINGTVRGLSSWLNSVLSFFPTIILIAVLSKIPMIQESEHRLYYMIFIIAFVEVGRVSEIFKQEFINIRKNEYITSAIVAGSNTLQLLKRYFLPNMYQKLIYNFITDMSRVMFIMGLLGLISIYMEQKITMGEHYENIANNASLSWPFFLGNYLQDIRSAVWIPFFTSAFMAYAIFSLNLFGEGLQQFFDRKLRFTIKEKEEKSEKKMHNEKKEIEVDEAEEKVFDRQSRIG